MGRRRSVVVGIAAAGLGVLAAQPLAGVAATVPQHAAGAAAPTLSVPTVTVPSATVPSATVPPVSTPVATTPAVTTPKVTTPTATTPSATTPSVTVPSVTTPRVSTPAGTVPSATTPSAAAPSATGIVRTTASKVSAAPGAPGAAASGAATGTGGQTSSAGGSTPSTSGDGASANAVAAMDRRHRATRPESRRARGLAVARESRRLRRLVARLRGCLGALDGGARHLLSLRAGLHGPARSATAAARILHVSARREATLERRAILALGRSAATGCAGSPAAVAPALAAAGLPALSSLPPGGQRTGSDATARASASLRTVRGSRSPRARGGRSLAVAPSGERTERAGTGASFPSGLVTALLVLLLALAMVVVPKLRRGADPVAAGPLGARAEPAQTRAASAPEGASGTDSVPEPQNEMATRAFRTRVPRMDSAIAPMAADAFSRMAHDADHATDAGIEPRAEDESEDQGDTD